MRTLFLCFILWLIDFYVFQAFKLVSRDLTPNQQKGVFLLYWTFSVFCLGILIAGLIYNWHLWPKALRTYLFAFVFIHYFSKLFIIVFLFADDIGRAIQWIYNSITSRKQINTESSGSSIKITRSDFLIKTGIILASVPFFSLLYGMVWGAYKFRVRNVNLSLKNLPAAFNGLKVLQISDIHAGSFNGKDQISNAVEIIKQQKADVIFFTGDLVNDRSSEAEHFIEILKQVKAPMGVFSIFGNHDYGDYVTWPSSEAKIANLENLKLVHKQLGWQLLLDESTYLEKDNERIGLIGIQNWSAHMRFPKYGSMDRAVNGFMPASVNILLSHDPSHWKAEVLEKYPFVDLMFSGHTHGFQYGIEIPGLKWSPVQYVYKEWAGLYEEKDRYLYVNRGLGFLGYPGRVGILPEITMVTINQT